MSTHFEFRQIDIEGVVILDRQPRKDARGFFERMFCVSDLEEVTRGRRIRQINRTRTISKGTARGMHFQYPPKAEMKLISCVRGRILDVVVDLRRGSSTFLKWHAVELSDSNHRTLVLAEGIAHGFQTLEDDSELLYLHTADYSADLEAGFNLNDPRIAIAWPLPINTLSSRDAGLPMLAGDFQGIEL